MPRQKTRSLLRQTRAATCVRARLCSWVPIALLAVVSGSCTPAPTYSYPQGVDSEGHPAPQRFLLTPFNLNVPLVDHLQGVTGNVLSAFIGYLRDRGHSIEILERDRAMDLWRASIAEIENSSTLANDYETVVRLFVTHISESTSFDALIMPSLVYRDTKIRIRERQVKWDGVVRRYRVINYSERGKKLKLAGSISPVMPAVSLYVAAFTPEGDSIFEKYGGLDLTHDVDLTGSEFTMTSDLVPRGSLLVDTDNLQEGIAVALDPYLPRD